MKRFRFWRTAPALLAAAVVALGLTGCTPSLAFENPQNGQILAGIVNIRAQGQNLNGPVQFKLDGANLGAPDSTAPYETTWDTTQVANKSYELTATSDSIAATPITVVVNNKFTVMVGDSNNWLAFQPGPLGTAPSNLRQSSVGGAQTWHMQGTVDHYDSKGQIESLIVALGTNDAGWIADDHELYDGWNQDDINHFQTMLDTPDAGTCVVVVLPGYVPGLIDATNAAHMDAAITDITAMANQRPNSPIVVWPAIINADIADGDQDGDGDVLDLMHRPDGIHIRMDANWNVYGNDIALQRQQPQWDALQECAAA